MAAKFDIKLHINLAATGEQFSEITMPLNASGHGLFGAKWNGTDAYNLIKVTESAPIVYDTSSTFVLKFDYTGLAELTTPAGANLLIINDGANKKITLTNLLSLAPDSKVAVDDAATPDYLGATGSAGALRVTAPVVKTDGGNFITLSVSDATTAAKGVASFNSAMFTVSAGAVSIVDASTTVKGIASFDTNDFTVTAGAVSLKIGGALKWVTAPASATVAGTAGQVAYDGNYFYICTAASTWRRTSIASWA